MGSLIFTTFWYARYMPEEPHAKATNSPKKARKTIWPRLVVAGGLLVALIALVYAWLFITTPAAIRTPQLEHAHVRLQFIADGVAVNFGEEKFQTHYAQACSDAIAPEPIHFHDGKDQFMHLHWKGITGGLVLKNYGLNMIGGANDTLGYRFDMSLVPQRVPIHGNNLPDMLATTPLWVYVGDETGYYKKAAHDFLYQDIESFLGKKSSVQSQAFLDKLLFAKASAHVGHDHDAPAQQAAQTGSTTTPSQAELAQINNLLGNIVVFAQKDEPSDAAIKERFNHLEPLTQSTCGG